MPTCSNEHPRITYDLVECPWCADRKARADVDGWEAFRSFLTAASMEGGILTALESSSDVTAAPVRLGVVVPVRNRGRALRPCLRALAVQTVRPVVTVVSDYGSRKPTRVLRRAEEEGAAVYRQEAAGWCKGAAVNPAVAELPGDCTHVLLVDVDIVLHPAALERISVWLGTHEAVAVVPRDVSAVPPGYGGTELEFSRLAAISSPRGKSSVGGVVALPVDWFRRSGGIDEGYTGWGYQDLDLWRRAEEELLEPLVVMDGGIALHVAHERQPAHAEDADRNRARFAARAEVRSTGAVECASPLVVMTTIWKRHELTRVVLEHYARIRDDLGGIVLVAAGSEGEASERLARDAGWEYVETPNRPLGSKHNTALAAARVRDPRGVVVIGSDSLIPRSAFEDEYAAAGRGSLLGFRGAAWLNLPTGECLRWPGYTGARAGHPLGTGRYYGADALDSLDWTLWPAAAEKSLDSRAMKRLARKGWSEWGVVEGWPVNVKSDVNVWSWEHIVSHLAGLTTDYTALGELDSRTSYDLRALMAPDLTARVLVSMPTIAGREESALAGIVALLEQMGPEDRIVVHRNGSRVEPPADHRVVVVDNPAGTGPISRYDLPGWTCDYLLLVDDDVVWPSDYIEATTGRLDELGRGSAVSCYARFHSGPGYRDQTRIAGDAVGGPGYARTSYAGSGSSAFHGAALAVFQGADRPESYQLHDDLWMNAVIMEAGIRMYRPELPPEWLGLIRTHGNNTLWRREAKRGFKTRTANMADAAERWGWRRLPRDYRDVVIGITHYNRPELLARLLGDIEREAGSLSFSAVVYDDGSDSAPAVPEWADLITRVHGGKPGFAALVSELYSSMWARPADLYVQLPDDARLCSGFFSRLREAWAEFGEHSADPLALTLTRGSGKDLGPCWKSGAPEMLSPAVWRTGWVDGCVAFGRDYLSVVGCRVPDRPDWWDDRPTLGSGVGRSLSVTLRHRGDLACVDESLVAQMPVASELNPGLRNRRIRTLHFADGEEALRGLEAVASNGMAIVRIRDDEHWFATHGETDHISRALMRGGFYELGLLRTIRELYLEGVYLDVGAHIGTHSVWYANQCGATEVHAFEAYRPSFDLLVQNLSDQPVPCHATHVPIGKEGGRVKIVQPPAGNTGMASTAPARGGALRSRSLDALFPDMADLALIKMDIEGGELLALRGAVDLIRRCLPVVVVEAHTEARLAELLRTRALKGYSVLSRHCSTPTYILEPPR